MGCQLIKLIYLFDQHGMKNLYGEVYDLLTLPFLLSLLGRDLHFVHPDSYISVYQLFNSVTHKGIGENSLRTVSGLKKKRFFPRIAPFDLYRTRDLLLFFCQLWIIIIIKCKQICILFTLFHTFQTFLCLVVPITNRLEKNR